jgi:hypothetical protein
VTLLLTEPLEIEEGSSANRERRRGLRIAQTLPVKIYDPTAARYFGGQTHDVSATGLRLELPAYAPIIEGQSLTIHVGHNHNGQSLANRRQMIPTRVVWVHRDWRNGGALSAGIEFLASIAAERDAA